jgi:uncharacterized protein (DUF58 family)
MATARRRDNPPARFRLTRAGWLFLGASTVVGVVALNSGLGLVFILFGCMLGALYASAILARRIVAGVEVWRDFPARCRQGRPVSLGYRLRYARGGACLALRVEEAGLRGLSLPPAACGYLPGRQDALCQAQTVPPRRGRFGLRLVRLSTTFPFGLVSASRQFAQEASLVVWPARGKLTRPVLGKGEAQTAAAAPSFQPGGQEEFYGLREYRLGDNAKRIHWRRSAGRQDLVVREMARPRPRTLWLVVDTRLADTSLAERQRRERAIRLAATVLEDALAEGYRVGAVLGHPGQARVVPPADRRAQRARLLDALAEVDDQPSGPLAATLGRLRPSWLRQAHVIVISAADPAEPAAAKALTEVRRYCRTLSVLAGPRVEELLRDDPALAEVEGR